MNKQQIIGSYKRAKEKAEASLTEHVRYLKEQGLYDAAKAQPQLNKLTARDWRAELEYRRALSKYS